MKNVRKVRKVIPIMVLLVILCNFFSVTAYAASTTAYDQLSSTNYAIVYTLKTSGKTIPYTTAELSQRGTEGRANNSSYIDNSQDSLRLYDVGINSKGEYWAKVSYPITGTNKRLTAYIHLSDITENTHSSKSVSTGRFYCSLRQNSINSSSYYVDKNDTVWLLSVSGTRCQILYPTSNGKYRIAFANVSDYEKYCGSTQNSTENGMKDVTAHFAGKTITIQSIENAKYLCADDNFEGTPLMANRDAAAGWETFIVSSLTPDGWIGFKAHNDKYLSAMADTTDTPVGAKYDNLNSWECFRIYLKDNNFYIKAQINNKWLCTRVDLSNAPVQAYVDNASTWERFNINIIAHQPEGCIDSIISNTPGTITLRGWCFDRDDLNALQIHVYVGGPAGDPNAKGYVITADTYRPDVHQVFGTGEYHGFDATLSVDKTGTQDVYVYAINAGAGNTNPMIGTNKITIATNKNNNEFDPIWPCSNTYTITALYKYSSGNIHSCRFRYGIDIGAPYGEQVVAVEDGTVICSEYSTTSGFGNWIMIQHKNGKVSLYAHLSSRKVSVGDVVSKGQVIGAVGNTSAKYTIGAHLHFELGNSNTLGATGDPYQEYYKTKYADKIVLVQAAKKYNQP